MGVKKEKKRKFNPRPKIDYPPVPTKKWIPPDLRRKKVRPPPQLMYQKPPGMDQKSRPTALRKIWRHYLFHEDTAILTGTFSQTHKRFTFRSNGLQSACNCALACVFAHILPMEVWDQFLMDTILILGDQLFRKSLEQDPDRCWTEISTDRVYTSIYIGRKKVSFEVDFKNRIDEILKVVNEDRIKRRFQEVIEQIFSIYFCGLFTMDGCKKVLAFWFKDRKYYLFDPTAHTSCGITWENWPGGGVSITYRCNTMEDFINRLYENITCHGDIILESLAHCHCMGAVNSKLTSKICRGRFWVEPLMVLRVTEIDTTPPDKYEDVRPILPPHEICFRVCPCRGIKGLEDKVNYRDQVVPTDEQLAGLMDQPVDIWDARLRKFLEDEEADNDCHKLEIEELSPQIDKKFSLTKRPSWLQEDFEKSDHCKFPIPYSKRPQAMSFYLDIDPGNTSIMRAGTHSRDTNFTKYGGRQSMGNAISSLIMLKFWKSKHWVPALLNRILKFGDLLYREAMISIPRTQSLKLSNFQRKSEFMGKYFLPVVNDYVVVGRLSCKEFEVLDLFVALETFLIENQCCVIIGPITLSVWVEDGYYYMFDPNERDTKGRTLGERDEPIKELDCISPSGKACLMRFKELKDLVELYMNNLERCFKEAPFYLSKVEIMDWVDIPETWYNFRGLAPGKWILRGIFHQGDRKYEPQTRNFQSPAISMVVMAMKQLKPIKEWTECDINELLDLGDRFYKETIDALKEKNVYNNKMLLLADINREFRFWQKLVEFSLEECVQNGIFTARNCNDVMNLYKALCFYFISYDLGIVTCRNMSVAVWKFDDMFFYCDSHSRDDKGLTTPFGTACIVRTCSLEDIAEMIMCNFVPNPEDYFNITNVKMTFYDLDAEGYIRPVILYYRKLTRYKFILRSLYSETHNRYELNVGKQTIPMMVMGICYNKLKPAIEWNQADIDEIMNKGDNLYVQSMLDILQKEETQFISLTMNHEVDPAGGARKARDSHSMSSEKGSEMTRATGSDNRSSEIDGGGDAKVEDEASSMEEIEINLNNMKKEFNIGLNKFTFIVEDVGSGLVDPDLRPAIQDYFEKITTAELDDTHVEKSETSSGGKPLSEGVSEGGGETESASASKGGIVPPFVDNSNMEIILLLKPYTVILWKDTKMYYLFDCHSRDIEGNVFGASQWSEVMLCPARKKKPSEDVKSTAPSVAAASTYTEGAKSEGGGTEGGGGDKIEDAEKKGDEQITEYDLFQEGEGAGMEQEQEEISGFGEYEATVEGILFPKGIVRSASYWAEMMKSGRACTLAFVKLEELLDHIIKNIPPKIRTEEPYQLKTIRVTNNPERKDIMRPDDLRNDVYEGQWYDFKEVDRGIWILRGTLSLHHELFPQYNRGRQQVMTAVCALGIVYTFGVLCFTKFTVDTILKYGDRLLTFVKKVRKRQMLEYDPDKLCDDEIDWILQHEEFGIREVPKKICIWKFMIHVETQPELVVGDIRAEPFEQLTDVKRGVDKFFEENRLGILESKDYAVAIWKGCRLYYMCDGLSRGPNGLTASCGTGCVTRYLKTENLVKTFLSNMTRLGKNNFYIHGIKFGRDICPRVRTPKVYIPPKLQCVANVCREIFPGKTIVRGSINQDDPKFGKHPSALSLPIAFIALTMTLIHKTQIWSKPILDDIIEIGNELYDISVDSLGFDFNPWEDKLNVCQVKHDFFVGVLRANLEVRTMDQKGVIEPPDPCTFNLRMGIQKFFDQNTHGVVITEHLIVAIWEEEIENADPQIYIYDPNSRGPTGLPAYNGVCCLISCNDPRMAAAHICSCILDPEQKQGPYRIVPVEIVVGSKRTRKKLRRVDTGSSLNILPRCTQDELNKEKRLIRKLAEYERKKKQFRALQLIGRKAWYILKNGDSIIRGYKSTNSPCYPESARNNQDLPMCIVSLVMHILFSIENWTYKNIDLVLDTGNQLYLDSYIAYGPKDLKLGPENIIRKFFLRHLTIKVIVYKPIITEEFNCTILNRVLNIYFSQEPFCMLSHFNQWVSLIAKSGHFYMFDPHERDIEGNVMDDSNKGEYATAVVIKCGSVESLVERLITNLSYVPPTIEPSNQNVGKDNESHVDNETVEENLFTLWLISVDIR